MVKNKDRIVKLKEKAQAKHIAEIEKAELLYNELIDDADVIFNSLVEFANIAYKERLVKIGNDTTLENKEAHMTLAFKDNKSSIDWAQLNYNEDLDDARERFHEIIGYANMIYKEELHMAEMNDRVEGCAGPGGNE